MAQNGSFASRGKLGGLSTSARNDPAIYTSAARAAFRRKFEALADPDGTLSEQERLRRADALRRLWYARQAMKSARVRAKKGRIASSKTGRTNQLVSTDAIEAGAGVTL